MSDFVSGSQATATISKLGESLEKIVADLNAENAANPVTQVDQRGWVFLFNQLTPKTITYLNNLGYLSMDGVPTNDVRFMFAGPPFNCALAPKCTPVANFIEHLKKTGGFVCMPAFGDVYPEIVLPGSVATESVVPFHLGMDTMLLTKVGPATQHLVTWLNSQATNFAEAADVIKNLNKFVVHALKFIEARPNLTIDEHRAELLVPAFGENWKKTSGNLSTDYFLALFGATEPLMAAFREATHEKREDDGSMKTVKLTDTARWIANFMYLFKPTTEFNKGACSDILNFIAMIAKIAGHEFKGKLTDADSVRALRVFREIPLSAFPRVVKIFVDMEPDDLGVLSFFNKHFPDTQVIRIYNNESLAGRVEALMASRLTWSQKGDVIIDPDLQNGKTVEGIYFGK